MRILSRGLLYLAAFLIPVLLTALAGVLLAVRLSMPRQTAGPPNIPPPPAPAYDAGRPTVAVVLGSRVHEITDVFGPYAMFVQSGRYNVYMVAEDRAPRGMGTRTAHTLSAALDLIPHYSFAELDRLLGRSPEIIVVPQMLGAEQPDNRPLLDYIRKHAGQDAFIFSWCTGANVLAAAGLLDGRPAATHWGDIDRLEREYPKVRWQRGVRYVEDGLLLTTGGLTSGVDATLYFLAQRHGPALAASVAAALHYQPSLELDDAPQIEQFEFGPADSIYLLNAAYNWPKRRTAVWLYDGVGDLELASALDAEASSLTARTYTVADSRRIITSQQGLHLLPHWELDALPAVARLLLPGGLSAAQGEQAYAAVKPPAAVPLTLLHAPDQARFCFEAPLEDLAAVENVPTAAFAAKRLEYRAPSLQLAGAGWPLGLCLQPLWIGGAGVGLLYWLLRTAQQRRGSRSHPPQAAPEG